MEPPDRANAITEPAKLTGYLLSDSHPVKRFKATFLGRLGSTVDSAGELEAELRRLIEVEEAVHGPENRPGRKRVVSGEIRGPSGRTARVLTVRFLDSGDDKPRRVTVYPEQP